MKIISGLLGGGLHSPDALICLLFRDMY